LKLFSIELEQAVRGEIFLLVLVIQTLFSNVLIVGQAAVSYLDYSNLASCPDMEWIFIDGSHVRAHQHSAGIANQSISKSVGGNSSKIHLIVDAHGNPIDFMITDGTTHDVKVAPDLISTLDLKETKVVCADKGYDSEPLREQIRKTGTKANIPKKTNSQSNNDHMDWYLYKIRHLVENMFCRLKQFRGIATRYDKLKRNYQSSVALACIFLWLPL
jgi:transposase